MYSRATCGPWVWYHWYLGKFDHSKLAHIILTCRDSCNPLTEHFSNNWERWRRTYYKWIVYICKRKNCCCVAKAQFYKTFWRLFRRLGLYVLHWDLFAEGIALVRKWVLPSPEIFSCNALSAPPTGVRWSCWSWCRPWCQSGDPSSLWSEPGIRIRGLISVTFMLALGH